MRETLLRLGGLLAVAVAAYIFISAIEQGLKPFKYAIYPIEDSLAWNETEIARSISQYLWSYRSMDIIALAFLLVVAAACCILILSSEEERRRRR
mgnify:CR=1 FL=1